MRGQLAGALQELSAVHLGHPVVRADDHEVRAFLKHLESFRRPFRGDHLEALQRESALERLEDEGLVVDEKEAVHDVPRSADSRRT